MSSGGDNGKNNNGDGGAPRVVRKYSNRRLYDAGQSRYITLDELKDLILAGEPLRVVNAADGADITRQTLAQVLLSEEAFGEPVFSEQSLRNLILFFRGPMRGPMAAFFDQFAPMFMDAQKRLTARLGSRANPEELNYFAAMQGRMVRRLLENYAFRALENYLTAQQRAEEGMERMMSMPMFGMAQYFSPPPSSSSVPETESDPNAPSGPEAPSGSESTPKSDAASKVGNPSSAASPRKKSAKRKKPPPKRPKKKKPAKRGTG